jgi:hypothetical protein
MSQENVEVANVVVRRWIWAFDNDTDAFRDILHPEIEWFPIEENNTPYYGFEAAMRYRNRWFDTWYEYRTELEEVVEGGDRPMSVVATASRPRPEPPGCSQSATDTWSADASFKTNRRPSKPWGCRSTPAPRRQPEVDSPGARGCVQGGTTAGERAGRPSPPR